MSTAAVLREIYDLLLVRFGPQHWCPGETPFEIMVGAMLTQNTSWQNAEKAIANLVAKDKLYPQAIVDARHDQLAGWLRPSGYFNIKAERLKSFCRWYLEAGEHAALVRLATGTLRAALLDVKGIGPETADDMLLYAFERPVFVIDAQGSLGGSASPFCRSSIEMLSGDRTKAMRPSRGGRLIVTPASISRWHTA